MTPDSTTVRTARLVLFFDEPNKRLVLAGRPAIPGLPESAGVPLGLLSYDDFDSLLLGATRPPAADPHKQPF